MSWEQTRVRRYFHWAGIVAAVVVFGLLLYSARFESFALKLVSITVISGLTYWFVRDWIGFMCAIICATRNMN